jgi:hypothetical protein
MNVRSSAVIWLMLCLSTTAVNGQPPGKTPAGAAVPPPGKGPPRSPEDFIERELAKVWDKAQKEGLRFDLERELMKLDDRYAKDFGQPLPEEVVREVVQTADEALNHSWQQSSGLMVPTPRSSIPSKSIISSPQSSTPPASRYQQGPHYVEGLPDWYQARDRDHDGQVGLYEWPRSEFFEFFKMDGNNDGLLVQDELIWFLKQSTPALVESD